MSGSAYIPTPISGVNYFTLDRSLQERLRLLLPAGDLPWAEELLGEMGALAGGPLQPLAEAANRHRPVLQPYDLRGERIDAIEFHPAYTEMARLAYGFGLAQMNHLESFRGRPGPAPRLVTQAAAYLFCHTEQGLYCPICMTDSAVRSLRRWGSPELLAKWLPRLTTLDYEQLWEAAMFLTEKAGGSDVGANECRAEQGEDGRWRLWGDKWFCSNAGARVALVLARPAGAPPGTAGLGLFLMPRLLDDGTRNHYVINRLKDKLGTWSMASGEIELQGAVAEPLTLSRGWVAMADMVNGTRQAIAAGTAGGMRRVFFDAREHARRRLAFGRRLDEHALMQRQLIDILLDVEAAQAFMLYTARGEDELAAGGREGARPLVRLLTTLAKWWNTARAVPCVEQCMEVLGGNGYIEDWPTARMFRDLAVHQIWEGTSNIMFLDVLRSMRKEATGAALAADLQARLAALAHPALRPLGAALAAAVAELEQRIGAVLAAAGPAQELGARRLVERLAPLTIAVWFAGEADGQARRAGEGRGLALAEAWVRRWLPDVAAAAGLAASDLDDPDVARFAALVDHAPLPLPVAAG